MKKHLLPEGGAWYKANLHCHSTISDGKLTPEELKKVYTEKGYSIIAYTDHNVMLDHSDLNDENFLALVGYELDVSEPYRGRPAISALSPSIPKKQSRFATTEKNTASAMQTNTAIFSNTMKTSPITFAFTMWTASTT